MRFPTAGKNWKASSNIALTALVGITAIWGLTFIIVQNAIAFMPVMDFLAWRFSIATIVMVILRPKCLRKITRKQLWHGVLLGTALSLAYIAQTYGLLYASATVSGLITGMFVVLTPVVSWILLREKTNLKTWLAVGLATGGLALLSLKGWTMGTGELLTLGCALFVAVHIVGLGKWSSEYEPYSFSMLQIATVGIFSLVSAIQGGITIPPDARVWMAISITSVFATAVAFLVQTWAQSLVPSTRAAVVMTLEPVFAGLFGVIIGGNVLTLRTAGGAACILAAIYLVQLKSDH